MNTDTVIHAILAHLFETYNRNISWKNLLRYRLVSRKWNQVMINSDFLWVRFCQEQLPWTHMGGVSRIKFGATRSLYEQGLRAKLRKLIQKCKKQLRRVENEMRYYTGHGTQRGTLFDVRREEKRVLQIRLRRMERRLESLSGRGKYVADLRFLSDDRVKLK